MPNLSQSLSVRPQVLTQQELRYLLNEGLTEIEHIFENNYRDDRKGIIPATLEIFNAHSDLPQAELEDTLNVCLEYHMTQTRDSGQPYASHSFMTGFSNAFWELPMKAVRIALFHDIIEMNPEKKLDILEMVVDNYSLEEGTHLVALTSIDADPEERHAKTYSKLEEYRNSFALEYLDPVKFGDGTVNLRDIHLLGSTRDEVAFERRRRNLEAKTRGLRPIAERLDKKRVLNISAVEYLESLVLRQEELLGTYENDKL